PSWSGWIRQLAAPPALAEARANRGTWPSFVRTSVSASKARSPRSVSGRPSQVRSKENDASPMRTTPRVGPGSPSSDGPAIPARRGRRVGAGGVGLGPQGGRPSLGLVPPSGLLPTFPLLPRPSRKGVVSTACSALVAPVPGGVEIRGTLNAILYRIKCALNWL